MKRNILTKNFKIIFWVSCVVVLAIWQVFFLSKSVAAPATIVAFETNGLAGNEVIFNATTNDANLNTAVLSRGAGINPQPLANGFSSTAYVIDGTKALAISNNEYFQVAIGAKANYRVSLNSINSNFRKSNTGPTAYQWQYSLDGFATAGIDVGAQGAIVIGDSGVAMPQIDLSGVANLQNVASGTVITFRLYAWGASAATGTFAIGRLAGNDLVFMGEVIDNTPPTFVINDGTATGPVQSDSINITASDTNLNAASLEYGFSTDNICNASDTYGNSFTNSVNFSIAGNHTDYLCVKASDAAGNIGYALVGQLNTDNTTPVLHLPADITTEATGSSGAVITYSASADDTNPAHPVVTCLPASGSIFSIKTTQINCSVADAAGNNTLGTFSATVQDTAGPVITLNGPTSVNLHIGDTYIEHGATAADVVDGTDTVNISGDVVSTSAPAVFHIRYDSRDATGNSAVQVIRTVNVSDISAPVINPISNVSVEATGPSGAVATYGAVTATDDVDGTVAATCLPSSGSTFPIGNTSVSCTATDLSGNVGNGTGLTVNVADNTFPTVTISPATQTVEAANNSGATANFTVNATDIVDGDVSVAATCDATSGGTFVIGDTTITCQVTDTHGNKGVGTAIVSVKDSTAPLITTPADQTFEATGSNTTPTLILATATDAVDASPIITYTPNSFPVGESTITWTAEDSSENKSTSTSKIIITDKTAPVITGMPADITIEATSSTGATVSYISPTATDIVDGSDAVTCLPASGTIFSIGNTVVTCTVNDTAGNVASKTFNVVITPSPTIAVVGGGGGGYFVPQEPSLAISDINFPSITTNSLTITWITNFPSSSYVVYSAEGESHSLNMSDNLGNPPKYGYAHATAEYNTDLKVVSHSVEITGLDPATTYYFRTVSRGSLAIGGEYQAITPIVAGAQDLRQVAETTMPVVNNIIPVQTPEVAVEASTAISVPNQPVEKPINEKSPVINQAQQKTNVGPALFVASLNNIIQKIFSTNLIIVLVIIALMITSWIIFKVYKKTRKS